MLGNSISLKYNNSTFNTFSFYKLDIKYLFSLFINYFITKIANIGSSQYGLFLSKNF